VYLNLGGFFMKKGTLLFLVAIVSSVLVAGCGSSTDQTSIIPAAPAAAAVVAPAAAVGAASVKVAGGTVTITTATAGATAPAAALTAAVDPYKVELTPGATYTVAVDPDGIAGNGDDYTFSFVQPAAANGSTALMPTAANFVIVLPNSDGTAEQKVFASVAGGTVDTSTTAPTSTTQLTAEQVTTTVGDLVAPAFTATFSHDTDVDADGKYTKGDKFKVTVSMSPAEAECKIDVTITADGGYKVVGTRTYNATAGSVTSAVITTTDIANPMPHDAAGTYMQSFVQTPQGFTMVATDGTFPYDGTYTYELKVTDKAGNVAKATGTVVVFP
jgi:hypothetical protein